MRFSNARLYFSYDELFETRSYMTKFQWYCTWNFFMKVERYYVIKLFHIHNENFQLKIHIQVKSWFEDFVIKNIMVQQFFIGWLVWKICYFYLHVDFKDFPFKRKIFRFLGCVPSHYFSLEWHIMSIVCKRKKIISILSDSSINKISTWFTPNYLS